MPFIQELINKVIFIIGSPQQVFLRRIKTSDLIEHFQEMDDHFAITCHGLKHSLFLRGGNSSDFEIFEQIFNFEEYRAICKLLSENKIQGAILDLGANIGLSSVYFERHVDNSPILAIEPDPFNYKILVKNTENYPTIQALNYSIAHVDNLLFTIHDNFRDGKEWSKTVQASTNGSISGITIQSLIQKFHLNEIALLKMDIEGYEKYIFENSDLSFLDFVKVIAVEVHEEFISKNAVYEKLKAFGFIVWETGELIVGLKASLQQ